MTNKIHFYGLLHLDSTQNSAMNVSVDDFSHQIDIYRRNALTLARTLAIQNIPFTLLTNRPDLIKDGNAELDVKEIPFETKVPNGIKFYSAHFKIDAFRYFSGIKGEYSILCDLDVVCINKFPNALRNLVKSKTPICYDISDQVIPAYGHETIIRDLECVIGSASEGRWYGGEFIGGTDEFFSKLYSTALELMPSYLENLSKSHHVSDEAIVSPSIELLRKQFYIADGGTIGIISRFWNCNVLHPQKPFTWSSQCFLMHLPADKLMLAEASGWTDSELENFTKKYESIHSADSSATARVARKAKSTIKKAKRLMGL